MRSAECKYYSIIDISLPGMDGLEMSRRIRSSERDGNIPIIAMTSFAMAGDKERIIAAGVDGYFNIPIDPLTIVERIHAIVGR